MNAMSPSDPESNSTDQEQPPISPISMQNTSSVTTNFTPPPRSSAPVFNNMPISHHEGLLFISQSAFFKTFKTLPI